VGRSLQFQLTLPIAGANLLQRATTWITWACVGHLGPDYLGPVTLASSVNNVLGTSVIGGLAVGVQTLASQAHGADDPLALSRILERAILVGLVGSLPCVLLLISIRPLLVALHMSQDFASIAGEYAWCVVMVTPCMGVQRAIGYWLVSQNNSAPRLIVQAVTIPVHAVLTWYLVFGIDLKHVGAGIAMCMSSLLQLAMTYAYISFSPRCAGRWMGFTREACRGWKPYLTMAVPGLLMNAEYWIGETLTFFAGLLPHPATCLSALAIYQLTQTTNYQFPSGVRMAVAARIGNQLGAGNGEGASLAQHAGFRLILLWMTLPTTILLCFTRQWGLIFTGSELVLQMLSNLVIIMLVYSNADAVLAYYNGVLSACGQQRLSGRWAIIGYVFLGFPLAVSLAFAFRLGVLGLVLGHTLGKVIHACACVVLVRRIDWNAETQLAVERVQKISERSLPLVSRG